MSVWIEANLNINSHTPIAAGFCEKQKPGWDREVYLLAIYDKGDQDTIADKEIDRLIAKI